MTKWKLGLLLLFYIIFFAAGKANAAVVIVSSSTILNVNPFIINPAPQITLASTLASLTQLPGDNSTNYAVISATIACGATFIVSTDTASGLRGLTNITINYYVDGQANLSSAHKLGAAQPNHFAVQIPFTGHPFSICFSTAIPVNLSNRPANFFYNIAALDNGIPPGQTYLPGPGAGDFNSFSIVYSSSLILPPPVVAAQLSHSQVSAISAIDGIFVATGTVTGVNGAAVASVGLDYYTDLDGTVRNNTITVSASPLTYNFRFELNKSNIDSAKIKYFYYRINVTDKSANIAHMPDSGYYTAEVITAKTVTCGANGGSFCLPNGNIGDGQTSLDIPQGALDGNTDITITQLDPADSSIPDGKSPCAAARPAAVYRFGPEGLTFNKFVTMKQVFQDIKHAGTVDGTTDKVNTLKLFWWDGFDWRLMGGKQDPAYNLINYGNIKHFSMYALFPAKAMGDNDYRPKERIITPATVDGYNDYATFTGLDNGDIVNIYDIRGRKIRQLNDGVNTWDGKDDGNQLVESGIYIYQIKLKATGKLISGTVVIAK